MGNRKEKLEKIIVFIQIYVFKAYLLIICKVAVNSVKTNGHNEVLSIKLEFHKAPLKVLLCNC